MLFAVGIVVRACLIKIYPIIFGGDSITRLVYHDRIFIAYQLPALQASIHVVLKLFEGPVVVRYWIAVIGAIAGVGFYYLAADLLGRAGAFGTAMLFVSNPFILAQSTVPYQEILMLATLFFAFHFFFTEHFLLASLSLGLSCLTRYEAWAACPVLVLAYLFRRELRPLRALKAALLFGWAPLVWILYHAGIAPGGTYVVEDSLSLARLARYVYLAWITVKFTPVLVLVLAAAGLWRFWKQGMLNGTRFRLLAAFLALFLLAILFSAHGVDPDRERFVTAREAHLPIVAVLLLAGIGLQRFSRTATVLTIACFAFGVFGAVQYMARETSDPHFRLAYDLAQYLDRNMRPNETALLLVQAIPKERVQEYLDRARRTTGGELGFRKAQQVLEQSAASPPDFQRVLVHSRVVKNRMWALISSDMSSAARQQQLANARPPQWIVIWSDFTAADPEEKRYYELAKSSGPPVATLHAGLLAAQLYWIPQ